MIRSTLTAFSLFTAFTVSAQSLHIGLFGGVAAYNGDLTEKILPKHVTNAAVGGTLTYEVTDNIMLRGQLMYTVLGGADRYSDKADLRARNLSFETRVYEASLVGQYYLLNLYDNKFTPYIFGGLAVYHFNPYTYGGSTKYYLINLHTEGQGLAAYPDRKPYKAWQAAIPLGGGIQYALTPRVQLGFELGIRKLFTDYLDDVSKTYVDPADLRAANGQRAVDLSYRGDELAGGSQAYPTKGDPRGGEKYKDVYYTLGFHLSYRLFGGREGRIGDNRRLGCPTNVY